MPRKRESPANAAATAVLFIVILLVSIALALWTDIPVVARGAIAVGVGILGALVTFLAVNRRGKDNH